MKTLDIKIASDISCPWCIIGYKALQQALENLKDSVSADISWLPFELNPDMAPEGQDIGEHIQEKYGATPEQSAGNRERIKQMGADLGFTFNRGARIYNTFDAHRLLHWAKTQSKQTELKLALFDMYFTGGGNPSDKDQIIATAVKVGLDQEQARAVLESDQYGNDVRALEQQNHQNGINAVPAFIINGKYMINGGQPVESFEKALIKISAEINDTAQA
ncbi:MAG: putative DsbA family dithiol-disulfide isomerase [Chitinophagales bacterium]|jgi:predicted DsbA family dithiol-disulfide isomerase